MTQGTGTSKQGQIIALGKEQLSATNLQQDMPDNSIIDESIRLYDQEVELALT